MYNCVYMTQNGKCCLDGGYCFYTDENQFRCESFEEEEDIEEKRMADNA